jgi:hypothetical protein
MVDSPVTLQAGNAMKYVAPARGVRAFNCPHCGAFAQQCWHNYPNVQEARYHGHGVPNPQTAVGLSYCIHCQEFALWLFDKMIAPVRGNAPPPNADLPPDVKGLYEEAASISALSPRGAAALLRLAIQHLATHLGGEGKNINADIASLVSKGLPLKVQQALDIVRVVGNNAVHPGQVDTDDPKVVGELFVLVNLIAEYMISMPNRVSGLYEKLPEPAREAIEKRDGKKMPAT